MAERKKQSDVHTICRDIRQKLRSILRKLEELRLPINHMSQMSTRPPNRPRLFVHFGYHEPVKNISGLHYGGLGTLALPDEPIQDQAGDLAIAIWHLRDSVKQWVRITGNTTDVDALARLSYPLNLCSDLANYRKHSRNDNVSGRNPRIGLVAFDTSKSGGIELAYDGESKRKTLFVSEPIPIPFRLRIHLDTAVIEDACAVFDAAVREWIKIMNGLTIFASADVETAALVRQLDALAASGPLVIREIPPPDGYRHL